MVVIICGSFTICMWYETGLNTNVIDVNHCRIIQSLFSFSLFFSFIVSFHCDHFVHIYFCLFFFAVFKVSFSQWTHANPQINYSRNYNILNGRNLIFFFRYSFCFTMHINFIEWNSKRHKFLKWKFKKIDNTIVVIIISTNT